MFSLVEIVFVDVLSIKLLILLHRAVQPPKPPKAGHLDKWNTISIFEVLNI